MDEGRRLREKKRERERRIRADVPAPFMRAVVWTREEFDKRERGRERENRPAYII